MTLRYGVIIKDNHEHIGSVRLLLALLAFGEAWLQNTTDARTLGVILNEHTWAFDEFTHPPRLDEPSISIQSFAGDYELIYSKPRFLEMIKRCRDLYLQPEEDDHDCLTLGLNNDGVAIFTHKSSSSSINNPDVFIHMASR